MSYRRNNDFFELAGKSLFNNCKIFCFNGIPDAYFVVSGREKNETHTWFNNKNEIIDIYDSVCPNKDSNCKAPKQIKEMFNIAKNLSKNIKFVRIDFLYNDNSVYFGEMTFFHWGGFVPLKPDKWELYFGNKLNIQINKEKD